MADINNQAELLTAVQSSGTYTMAPGVYGHINSCADNVTLMAENPANKPEINRIALNGTSGLTLENVRIQYIWQSGDASSYPVVSLANCHNFTADGCEFVGDFDNNGYAYGYGIRTIDCNNTLIQNSEFTLFAKCIVPKGDGIIIQTNEFHNFRADAISLDVVSNITIDNNYMHTRRYSAPLDHGDGIQMMLAIINGTFRNNLIQMFDWDYFQQIFGSGSLKSNLLIENNVIFGSHAQGISGGNYQADCRVLNNKIIQIPNNNGLTGGVVIPKIIIHGNPAMTISGNIAPQIWFNDVKGVAGNTQTNLDPATEWAAAQADPRWAPFFAAQGALPVMPAGGVAALVTAP